MNAMCGQTQWTMSDDARWNGLQYGIHLQQTGPQQRLLWIYQWLHASRMGGL